MPMLPSQQNPSRFDLQQAEIYDTDLVPAIVAPATDVLFTYIEPKAGERVLDVASCTSVVSRHLATWVGTKASVTGLDITAHAKCLHRQVRRSSGLQATFMCCPSMTSSG